MLGRDGLDHLHCKLILNGVRILRDCIDGRNPDQHAIGNSASQGITHLGKLLVYAARDVMVSHNGPVGEGLVSVSQVGIQSDRGDVSARQINPASSLAQQRKTLRWVAKLWCVQLQCLALVCAVGNRQHDAITFAVDISAAERFCVDHVAGLLALGVHNLRQHFVFLLPVSKRCRDHGLQVDWRAFTGQSDGGAQ